MSSRDEEQLPGFHQLIQFLSSGKLLNLAVQAQVFEGEGHTAGVIGKTILEGLKAVFQD